MKKFVVALLFLSMIFMAGCYSSPKDTTYRELTFQKDYDRVWDVTLAVLKETYTIEAQDKAVVGGEGLCAEA